jgi:hypothetical protein
LVAIEACDIDVADRMASWVELMQSQSIREKAQRTVLFAVVLERCALAVFAVVVGQPSSHRQRQS